MTIKKALTFHVIAFAFALPFLSSIRECPAQQTAPTENTPVAGAAVQEGEQASTRRNGRGRGGPPISAEDQVAIEKLGNLPAWSRNAKIGDFSIAPPFDPAPENAPRDGVPRGRVETFYIQLSDSQFYPPGGGGNGRNATEREVVVYIPAQYEVGTAAPLLFTHDAMGAHDREPAPYLPTILDNMIHDKRLPVMIAVMVMPSNQRSLEYDTVSGKYAEYIEAEVLPRVEKDYNVTISKDPDARATLGGSSGGAAALSMAWFHPELYRRVLVFSGTFVNLRNDPDVAPHGAWEYHEHFIPNTIPNQPLRIWLEVGANDNGARSSDSSMRNWVLANMHMAAVLKAKNYNYQFIYAKDAGHVDRPVRAMTLAPALEWLWRDD